MSTATVVVHGDDGAGGAPTAGSVATVLSGLGFTLRVVDSTGPAGIPDEPTDLVVVMGSDAAAYDDTVPWLAAELAHLARVVERGVPVLGICFGGQALARVLGGTVAPAVRAEHGLTRVHSLDPALVPTGPWMESHSDAFTLPPGAQEVARTDVCLQAFTAGPHLGVQFHPEMTPATLATCVAQWRADDAFSGLREEGLDLDAVTADLDREAGVLADRCRELVTAFCRRAGLLETDRSVGPAGARALG